MSKNTFRAPASSSRATGVGFGGFSSVPSGSTLSYLTEPPNLDAISDANVKVSFKNISKKDSTTKSKALEELRTYVRDHPSSLNGGVEDAVIDVWVGLTSRIFGFNYNDIL
jgi:hypothetical protein